MKRIKRQFNLRFSARESKFENPNIGPLLSPHLPRTIINDLCTSFNKSTSHIKTGLEIYLTLTLFKDNSFFYILKNVKPIFLLNLIISKTYCYLFYVYYFNFFILKKIKVNNYKINFHVFLKLNFKNLLHGIKSSLSLLNLV